MKTPKAEWDHHEVTTEFNSNEWSCLWNIEHWTRENWYLLETEMRMGFDCLDLVSNEPQALTLFQTFVIITHLAKHFILIYSVFSKFTM